MAVVLLKNHSDEEKATLVSQIHSFAGSNVKLSLSVGSFALVLIYLDIEGQYLDIEGQ